MTKDEAIKAMKEGKKVTHPSFTSDEYITMLGNFTVVTEEGYEIDVNEFWKYRTHINFSHHWTIYDAH